MNNWGGSAQPPHEYDNNYTRSGDCPCAYPERHMSNKNADPSKTDGVETGWRLIKSRRVRVIVHVLLSLLFATLVSWQVARFLE